MQTKTVAIVLNTIKYGENSLIAKCLTEQGICSYMLKGILKTQKAKITKTHFLPLMQLTINTSQKNIESIGYIKDLSVNYRYQSIHNDFNKSAIVFFLSEFLTKALNNQTENIDLIKFIGTSLQWFDTHNSAINFHIVFCLKLSSFLGFSPEKNSSKNKPNFDLLEGVFTEHISKNSINKNIANHFKSFINKPFDESQNIKLSGTQRTLLLEEIITYYQTHLEGFGKIRSLETLKNLFH